MDVLMAIGSGLFWLFILIGIPFIFMVLSGAFNEHCFKKFNHRFFTIAAFIISAIASPSIYWGWRWYNAGDTDNGMALIAIGALFALGLYWYNIKRSNIIYGLAATTIVLAILGVLAFVTGVLFLVLIAFSLYGMLRAKPVYIVNI